MNKQEAEIDKAELEFKNTVGACYLFLRDNGAPKDHVRKLFRKVLEDMMNEMEKEVGNYRKS